MRRSIAFMAVATLGLALTAAHAKQTPSGTLRLSGGSVAAGIGVSWGSGTLTYKGKSYPIEVKGLSAGDVGAAKIEASGKVYNLKSLDDFDGNYTGVAAGGAVAGGGSVTRMKNQNGVTVTLTATTRGIKFTLGAGGVEMKVKR
jgi:hypothetical protein